jgi:hypothetical protein
MVLNRLKTSIKVIGSDHIKQLSRYTALLQNVIVVVITLYDRESRPTCLPATGDNATTHCQGTRASARNAVLGANKERKTASTWIACRRYEQALRNGNLANILQKSHLKRKRRKELGGLCSDA